jgi:1,4-dihydroxy-2-naphthoate octaprenyltransferase
MLCFGFGIKVFVFQGSLVFFISYHGIHPGQTLDVPLLPCLISSLLIGALYPLTQVYQHEEDRKDGVTTISYLLGKRGSFVFSMFLFLMATVMVFLFLKSQDKMNQFTLFLLSLLPVVLFFLYWMWRVWGNEEEANFRNSLRMNVLSTFCTTLFFTTLIIQNH